MTSESLFPSETGEERRLEIERRKKRGREGGWNEKKKAREARWKAQRVTSLSTLRVDSIPDKLDSFESSRNISKRITLLRYSRIVDK